MSKPYEDPFEWAIAIIFVAIVLHWLGIV